MRAELATLKARIGQLESRLGAATPPAPAPPVITTPSVEPLQASPEQGELPLNAASPTYWTVPGSATQVRFSGYIRLGAYKDLADNLNSYKFRAGDIHPAGDPRRDQAGNIQAQLRLSRISFDSRTPTRLGELRTMLAMDFAGAEPKTYQQEALQNNGFHLRLTHAYASLGPFSVLGIASEVAVGQTWSNFLDDPDRAESIDPSGPADVPSQRQPQLRYTALFGEHALSFAIENPVGEYQGPGTRAASDVNNTSTTNRWPDLTVKYEVEAGWGRAQVSGIARWFNVSDGLGHAASATGYGVLAGGTLYLAPTDQVGGQAWFGEGIGKYVPDEFGTPNGFAVANYGSGLIEARTQQTAGGSLWLRHFWSPVWRSNLAIGYGRQSYAAFVQPAPDQAPVLETSHLNLIYTPLPMVDLGVELEYGRKTFRRELGLEAADAVRLGFSSRVKFN
ncbi:MAG: hypothetical protein JWO51_1305 [Rhodospirillales bacterium]|nr:hypothetical protein [Rhodospirillales bacterium]